MNIIPLPPGDKAPETTDCIRIQQLKSGAFTLTATVRPQSEDDGQDDEDDGDDSVSLLEMTFASFEEAEEAGLAWAAEQGVENLYVSVSNGTEPLPDLP